MNIVNFIKLSAIVILVDGIYLNLVKKHFNNQLKLVQGEDLQLNMVPTILAYIFICIGLYYFIVYKGATTYDAFLLGLVIYMIYELTNKAIIKNWQWTTVLLDGLWGGILFALVHYIFKMI